MDPGLECSELELNMFISAVDPILSNLQTNPSEHALRFVYDKITSVSPKLIDKVGVYVMNHVVNLLMKGGLSEDCRREALNCIGAVKCKSRVKSVEEFKFLYTLVCDELLDKKDCTLAKGLSEELKLAVFKCLKIFINRLEPDLLVRLYANETTALSQGILLSTEVICKERFMELRCSALEFLLAASQYGKCSDDIIDVVSDSFAQFTPGIARNLSDVMVKDDLAQRQVLLMVVRALGHCLFLVLRDFPVEISETADEKAVIASWFNVENRIADDLDAAEVLKKGIRCRKWARNAAKSLQNLLKHFVASCLTKTHSDVRAELTEISGKLLKNCSENLGPVSGVFLDALVLLSDDENATCREKAKKSLKEITTNFRLRDVAKSRQVFALEELNRNLQAFGKSDETKQSVALIASYFNFSTNFENTGPDLVTNPLLLPKLVNLLTVVLKTALPDEILHQYESEPLEFYSLISLETINKSDRKTDENLGRIFEALAKWNFKSTAHLLIDSKSGLENLSALNQLISRANFKSNETFFQYLVNFLNEKALEADLSNNEEISLKETKISVLQASLAVQGLGFLSKLTEKSTDNFYNYLITTTYTIFEKMGSKYAFLRTAAISAAETIVKNFEFGTVKNFVEQNLDFVTDRIIKKLRRTSNEGVLDAVRVLAKLCPQKTVHLLQNIVDEILAKSVSQIYSSHVESYLRVFLAFVYCAGPVETFPDEIRTEKPSVIKELKDYITRKEKDVEICEEEEEEKSEKNLPAFVLISSKVVRRTLHYLPICPDKQKVMCLEILDRGLTALADNEDQLLPLVHEVWSPLVQRFGVKTRPLIISRSFRLLRTLSHLSKDFIRHRTLKEVLPTIRDFLGNASKTSQNHTKDVAYETTQYYKLQRELLAGLGGMTCDLKLHERETDWVVEAALPYLSKNQPKALQKCAICLYQTLFIYDAALVTYRLTPIESHDEFVKNIHRILA